MRVVFITDEFVGGCVLIKSGYKFGWLILGVGGWFPVDFRVGGVVGLLSC